MQFTPDRTSHRSFWLAFTLCAVIAVLPPPLAASDGDSAPGAASSPSLRVGLDTRLFPVAPSLADGVDFWTKVYTEYDSNVVLLHDERHLHVVYAALDFTELKERRISEGRKRSLRRANIKKAREKYRHILSSLAAGKTSRYPNDQARVEAMFDKVPGNRSRYSSAAGRLRTQTCLSDRFHEAIGRSGLYMARMERIFQERGLPVELTRLPFVESMFQWHAKSSAAAGGIWQFMPATGRIYLDIEAEYDERYDPLIATDAAARLLSDNHKALGTWPLAITAYNHGRAGMKRAVRRLRTRDLGTIAQKYRSRTFGFASRNFYVEFVAAAKVYANRDHYFPDAVPRPPLSFDEFVAEHYVPLPELTRAASSDLDALKEMNPALSREIWGGHLYLPKGYALKLPAGTLGDFQSAYSSLPASRKSSHQVGLRYKVRKGDTLGKIARRYGTSISALQRANRLASANRIRIGQVLLIPPSASGSRVAAASSSGPTTHVVRRGENLSRIARKYGTSVKALQRANRLRSANHLKVGQRLIIP